jgi:hypothetical protein
MPELKREREKLVETDRLIADGERLLADQKMRIRRMIARGEDATNAKETLLLLKDTIETWREERQLILAHIAWLTAASSRN